VPIFDTLYVMTLRILKGKNPLKGSPDHFALRLRRLGLSVPAVTSITWGGGALLGGLGIFNLYLTEPLSLFLVGGVSIFLAAIGLSLSRVPGAGPEPVQLEEAEATAVREARGNLAAWRRR
jgi:UDP-GlcNAc:undecaprenyl-phosphate/decaprenyl-phosphate GlcNAc-1-phosphate transferase